MNWIKFGYDKAETEKNKIYISEDQLSNNE